MDFSEPLEEQDNDDDEEELEVLQGGSITEAAAAAAAAFYRVHAVLVEEEEEEGSGSMMTNLLSLATASRRNQVLLQQAMDLLGLDADECMAVGDGANDIPMIERAGLGVAYHAKPKAAQAANVAINHNDLTSLLYLQGIPSTEWIVD